MFCVVRIGTSLEAPADLYGRCTDLNKVTVVAEVVSGELSPCISDSGIHERVNQLGVVLMHDLFLNKRSIFILLREPGLEQHKLSGQYDLENEAIEDGDARSCVEWRQREKHHVDENVTGAK